MGTGQVVFKDRKDAEQALAAYNGVKLDNRALQLKIDDARLQILSSGKRCVLSACGGARVQAPFCDSWRCVRATCVGVCGIGHTCVCPGSAPVGERDCVGSVLHAWPRSKFRAFIWRHSCCTSPVSLLRVPVRCSVQFPGGSAPARGGGLASRALQQAIPRQSAAPAR